MRKNRFGMIAALTAALFGAEQHAQEAAKSVNEAKKSMNDLNHTVFYPNSGTSPKNFGMYIATRSSHKAKSKTKQKKAFG